MQVNKIKSKRSQIIFATLLIAVMIISTFAASQTLAAKPPAPITMDPKTIPKYVNQLVVPPVYTPDDGTTDQYTITMKAGRQQVLPIGTPVTQILPTDPVPDGKTGVWGYSGDVVVKGSTLKQFGLNPGDTQTAFLFSPSATFEAVRGNPVTVNWVNAITQDIQSPFAVDPTLNWANPTNAFPPGDIFSTSTNGIFPLYPPGFDGTNVAGNPDALNAQSPVPLVPHLHGAEVSSLYDGGPEAWWTASDTDFKGGHYATLGGTAPAGMARYYYPNGQESNTLWYHDHALGMTRLNVMSGLAGFYLLREAVTATTGANTYDQALTAAFPYGISEIPIAIQDRTFKINGEFWFPEVGLNPTIHPYWMPEFFGDTIMVNGQVWPNLDVTPGWYRFRLLDGSNARFYTIALKDQITGAKIPFTLIGADGGYLQTPVALKGLTIAPGERADILVDLSNIAVGTTILVENKAKAPFPAGAQANPQTTGQIMQITVKAIDDPTRTNGVEGATAPPPIPPLGANPTLPLGQFPTLQASAVTTRRYITLNEVMGPGGPIMVMINGQYYDTTYEDPPGSGSWVAGVVTEKPKVGETEEWVIINLTADTHPIHLHLVTFQLVSRQPFDVTRYNTDWLIKNAPYGPPFPKWYDPTTPDHTLDPLNYYKGKAILPTPTEMTWKDTLQMNPGEVTTIRVRFTAQDGLPFTGFDPTEGLGYVYHCHIIDHEDNEMMRPFQVIP